MRRIVVHNYLPARLPVRDSSARIESLRQQIAIAERRLYGPNPNLGPGGVKMYKETLMRLSKELREELAREGQARDEAGRAVPREQEDRNRADAYRRTGISHDAPPRWSVQVFGEVNEYGQKRQSFIEDVTVSANSEAEAIALARKKTKAKNSGGFTGTKLKFYANKTGQNDADPTHSQWIEEQKRKQNQGGGGFHDSRDANQAYKIKVRQLATGSDFTTRIFAASQEDAEKRAKERARAVYKIPPEKYRDLQRQGIAVFRIVESSLDPDQSRPNYDAASKGWEIKFDEVPGRHKIANESDREVEAVAKRLKIWDPRAQTFPHFTIYRDGEEIGGG
jgi:hypothetical protein